MSKPTMLPGIKLKSSHCVVCNVEKKETRRINSSAGEQKNLSELLKKYGEVDIVEGTICRSCERRLLHLHKECSEFYEQCQNTFYGAHVKRCANSSPLRPPLRLQEYDNEQLSFNQNK